MDPLAAEIARLRAELVREKDGRARAEDERDSLAHTASTALDGLRRGIQDPVTVWIHESKTWTASRLLGTERETETVADGGPWRAMVLQPLESDGPPAFAPPIVPVRAAIPAEVFDHIASCANLATLSTLGQVDYAWLARFNPLVNYLPDHALKSRTQLVSLLTRGGVDQSAMSARLEPHLSLQNLTQLNIMSPLIQDDAFPELSLDKLGLDGSPLRLRTLVIGLALTIADEFLGLPAFRPSLHFLSLVDPAVLTIRNMAAFAGPGPTSALLLRRDTALVSRATATVICGWPRLESVALDDIDLHVTPNDLRAPDASTHEFFLCEPGPTSLPPVCVWWDLRTKTNGPATSQRSRLLDEPVEYFAARQPLQASKVKQAFLVLPDDKEREKEKARTDVPALIKIIAAVGEEDDA